MIQRRPALTLALASLLGAMSASTPAATLTQQLTSQIGAFLQLEEKGEEKAAAAQLTPSFVFVPIHGERLGRMRFVEAVRKRGDTVKNPRFTFKLTGVRQSGLIAMGTLTMVTAGTVQGSNGKVHRITVEETSRIEWNRVNGKWIADSIHLARVRQKIDGKLVASDKRTV